MKPIISLLILLLFSLFSFSQKVVISGFVRDSLTNEPLIGATIWEPNLKIGTIADRFGHYSIQVPSKRTVVITTSFIGYQMKQQSIKTESAARCNFELNAGINLNEVAVFGQKNIESRIEMGVLNLPVKEIKGLPSIGAPDVLKVMQLMPGIQGGAEGRSGLYVRGGSPDQNLMLLDGASVYYVNHYGNFLSLFHPDIISNLKLYKGSFPARYGGRLSSVVDMRMREGNKKEHKGSFSIGLLSADLLLEGPIKKDTTSYIFSARRFYLDALLLPYTYMMGEGVSIGYKFYDIYGKIAHTINENNHLYLSYYSGNDGIAFGVNPWENPNFKGKSKFGWGNILTTTRLNTKLNDRMVADFIAGYTRYHLTQTDDFKADSNYFYREVKSTVQDVSLKSEFNYTVNNWFNLSFGAGAIKHYFQPGITSNKQMIGDSTTIDNILGNKIQQGFETYAYIENELQPTSYLKFNMGARYTSYLVERVNYQKIEPRLLAMIGTELTGVLKFSYTENMQPLHLLSYQNVGTPTDLWLPATKNIKPSESKQWSVGYAKSLFANYEVSVEAYQKNITGLIDYKDGVSYQSTDVDWQQKVEPNGEGTSKGIEFLFKKNGGKTTGWVGYTLAKSDRYFENKNNGKRYPYIYDRRHDISVVVNHSFNKKYNLSASWVFGSGYPFTLEMGRYNIYDNSGEDYSSDVTKLFDPANKVILYSDKNGVRMGNSHRLDLCFQINGKTKKGRDKTWSFNLYNAYNHQNPAYYYYGWRDALDHSKGITLWQQSGIPIMPSFTYTVHW